jgi:hypothetical protein
VVRDGLGWALWLPLVNLGVAAVQAGRAVHENPRPPEALGGEELAQATAGARSCPRCAAAILSSEWRCPACKSFRHQLVIGPGGLDMWMPIVGIVALVGIVIASVMAR